MNVRPDGVMRLDGLRALPQRVRGTVALGMHRGTACALALVQLWSDADLSQLEPRFLV